MEAPSEGHSHGTRSGIVVAVDRQRRRKNGPMLAVLLALLLTLSDAVGR